jgi:hypothetical protein
MFININYKSYCMYEYNIYSFSGFLRLALFVGGQRDFMSQGNGSNPKYVDMLLYFHRVNIKIIFRDTHWHPLM